MALSEAAIGSLISGGFALAGSAGSAIYGGYRTKKQMRLARELANQGMTQDQLQAFELNAGEAQKAREFALDMDSTNYQRKVADMQAAGVNPALAIGGVQAAPSSNAMGNAQASGPGAALYEGTPDFSAVAQAVGQYFQFKNMQKQNELLQTEIDRNKIENSGRTIELQYKEENIVASLDAVYAGIKKDTSIANYNDASASWLRKQESRYDELTDANLAEMWSSAHFNEAQTKVAKATFEQIMQNVSWMPRVWAAQVAGQYAAAGRDAATTRFMRFDRMKQVTLKTARSMGVNFAGFGINGSMSDDTLVLVCPTDDGKSWDMIGYGAQDVNTPTPVDTSMEGIKELQREGQ